MKEQLKKLIDPSLIKTIIICGILIYAFIFIIPGFYPQPIDNSAILQAEKEKFEYKLKIQEYMHKVDSLETEIKNLENQKQTNIIIGNQKKVKFRELTPTEKIIEFTNLFNSLN